MGCHGRNKIGVVITNFKENIQNVEALAMDFIGGSKMKEWLPEAQRTLESFAKDNNCSHLEGYGRKAWKRWLDKYGWEPDYIAYRMEING